MSKKTILAVAFAIACAYSVPTIAGEHPAEHPTKKQVTVGDVADGIKKHIAEGTKAQGGVFKVKDGDGTLSLTLLKVHDDKLAILGPGNFFACTDLKGDDGNTYDVDFFLTGEPGAMKVTETNVHKVNGKPRYSWKQQDDGTWTKESVSM